MKMKPLIVVGLAMMAATIYAGEKIAPDLSNLDPEWLISAKVLEEDGEKYFHIEDIGGDIARVAYPSIPLKGAKKVKVSLKYRTDVAISRLHSGAWYLIGFSNGSIMTYSGVFFEPQKEWTSVEKVIDVPADAKSITAELRIQLETPEGENTGKFFDAKNIVIELVE